MAAVLIDLRPLRGSIRFRRWWIARSVSAFGSQLTFVAVFFQIWTLTGDPAWTGAVALAAALPVFAVGLLGGALIDRVDRRRLYLLATAGQAVGSVLLGAQAVLFQPWVPAVIALVALHSLAGAFAGAAAHTMVPRLLPAGEVAAGLALNRIGGQAALLIGPVLAGVVIGWSGVGGCYLIDGASFVVGLLGAVGLPSMPPIGGDARAGFRGVLDGFAFLRDNPVVRGALLVDLAVGVLSFPVSLFPLINQERLGGDPRTLGLLFSAIAIGGVLASALSGPFTRTRRPGVALLAGAATWAGSMIGLGLTSGPGWALGLLVVAGAADTVTVVGRGTLIQLATPDSLRGRVSAAELAVGQAGPDLGSLRAGLVAQAFSGPVALVSGGLLGLLAVGAVGTRTPGLRRSWERPPTLG